MNSKIKDFNIFILIILILMISYCFCNLKITEKFSTTSAPLSICSYEPSGSKKEYCVTMCNYYNNDTCTVSDCEKKCNECDDPEKCLWINTNIKPNKAQIHLYRDNDIYYITWVKPFSPSSVPIFKYMVIIESPHYDKRVRKHELLNVNDENIVFKIDDLENYKGKNIDNNGNIVADGNSNDDVNTITQDTYYDIYVYSKNLVGYSEKSNIIRFIPDYDYTNIDNQKEKNYVYKYDIDGNIVGLTRIKYTDNEKLNMTKKLVNIHNYNTKHNIKEKYNLNFE